MRKIFFQVGMALFILFSAAFPSPAKLAAAQDAAQPDTATVAGTMQSELGCSGDWMPGCEKTYLAFDPNSNVWVGAFNVTPGNDQDKNGPRYKVALNGSWDENYGKNAARGGADIPLVVDQAILVSFFYDHQTHVVADDYNTPIVVAVGDFQTQLGCAKDDDPGCLRSWLQDPEGDGAYAFATKALKAGSYSVGLTISQKTVTSKLEAVAFTVAKDNDEIYFGYDTVKKELIVSTTGAPKGSLAKQKAIWVNQDTILWNIVGSPKYSYSLFYSREAALQLTAEGVSGGLEIPLTFSKSGPGGDVFKQNPYLSGFSAFKLAKTDLAKLPEILRCQVAVIVRDNNRQSGGRHRRANCRGTGCAVQLFRQTGGGIHQRHPDAAGVGADGDFGGCAGVSQCDRGGRQTDAHDARRQERGVERKGHRRLEEQVLPVRSAGVCAQDRKN